MESLFSLSERSGNFIRAPNLVKTRNWLRQNAGRNNERQETEVARLTSQTLTKTFGVFTVTLTKDNDFFSFDFIFSQHFLFYFIDLYFIFFTMMLFLYFYKIRKTRLTWVNP